MNIRALCQIALADIFYARYFQIFESFCKIKYLQKPWKKYFNIQARSVVAGNDKKLLIIS